jgi:hypothetical protein
VTAGQHTSLGTVTAEDDLGQIVTDGDATNYFGSAPGISVTTFVEADDANSPPGPNLAVGDTATFVYLLTNTGNVPVGNIVVVDDNGTPGNAADDFNPAYGSGDANLNGLIDANEIWIYFAMRTVTAGQHTSLGAVVAEDSIGQIVADTDPANYFGVGQTNADFNSDGIVDAADYIIWRKYNGTSVPAGTLGDADQNGEVNDLDYDIWLSQFGTSPGTGSDGAAAVLESQNASLAGAMESAAGSPAIEAAIDAEAAAVHDAVFRATTGHLKEWWRRPVARWQEGIAAGADNGDWPALIAALAERRVNRDPSDERGESSLPSSEEVDRTPGELRPIGSQLHQFGQRPDERRVLTLT